MTKARVAAHQAARPAKGVRMLRGTVSAVSPLTVAIGGGTAVRGTPVPGAAYAVNDAVLVVVQEPGIGPVYPLGSTPSPLTGYVPTSAFSAMPTVTNLDTAADGFAFVPASSNPSADGGALLETFSTTINGTPWRIQRLTSEQNGGRRIRVSWAGSWAAWMGGSAAVSNSGTRTNWDSTSNVLVREGRAVSLRYQVNVGATPPTNGTTLGTIPLGFRPVGPVYFGGQTLYTGAWSGATWQGQINADGTIVLNQSSAAVAANHGLFLHTTYPAA